LFSETVEFARVSWAFSETKSPSSPLLEIEVFLNWTMAAPEISTPSSAFFVICVFCRIAWP
jgi:hypothetical protein